MNTKTQRNADLRDKGAHSMRHFARISIGVFALLLVFVGLAPAQITDKLFLEGGRIVPVDGKIIEKGNLLIQNGRIEAMGAELKAPFDAKVIDVTGKTIVPGFVEAMTARGLDRANESVPVAPFLQVFDAIDPSDAFFEEALRNGYTSIHISQGNNTVVAGVSRVVRPLGLNVEEMTQKPDGGLKISFSPRSGTDHAVQLATMRNAFVEMDRYLEDLAEKLYAEDKKKKGEEVRVGPKEARKEGAKLITIEKIEDKYRNLHRLRHGKMDAFVWCGRAMDVANAIPFAKEHGFFDRMTLVLGSETYKAVSMMKGLARPVIVPRASFVHREVDRVTQEEKDTYLPSVLKEAGVKFTISDAGEAWYAAASLVRNGMSREEAHRCVTLTAAEAIGMDHRIGSIAKGKEGNILVLSGDPLDTMTWVDMSIIEGRIVYERRKDKRLRHLIQGIFDTKMHAKRADAKKAKSTEKTPAAPKAGEKKN